jgi:hypothetical protein
LVEVHITKTSPWSLQGTLIRSPGTFHTALQPSALPVCP